MRAAELTRQQFLDRLAEPETFLWATGIEDTFITCPWPATGRTLDEYELTGHYDHWRQDLDRMASLGVRVARYGVPWHRINPATDTWDWSFADATLGRMLELGIDPIVDLVHYGLPAWIDGAYDHPDFPQYMAEYAARLADRFCGRIRLYTPLNEPRVAAWFCGKIGWWPPHRRGWRGYLRVLLACCRGIVETVRALHTVDPGIVPVHVDATDLFDTADPALESEAALRQEHVFLALDLMSGRVGPLHPLYAWVLRFGASEADLAWFAEHAIDLPVIGINLYPMFSRKVLTRTSSGLRARMPYASADIVERLGEMYWRRYGAPLLISETASVGSVGRRRAWLADSVAAARALRERGVPVVGYTWWPMFSLVTWAYRQGTADAASYLRHMGLWDLRPGANGTLERVATPLVGEYQRLVAGGIDSVGRLAAASVV
jgi:beta-glucosidase